MVRHPLLSFHVRLALGQSPLGSRSRDEALAALADGETWAEVAATLVGRQAWVLVGSVPALQVQLILHLRHQHAGQRVALLEEKGRGLEATRGERLVSEHCHLLRHFG